MPDPSNNRASEGDGARAVERPSARRSEQSIPGRFRGWLRDSPWLTLRRARLYSGAILFAYLIASIAQLAQAHGLMLKTGLPVGGDFADIYAASITVLTGKAAAVYNLHLHHLQQIAIMGGRDFGVLGFHYPPMYLAIVSPLSILPFAASWLVFESVTLVLYLIVLARVARAPAGLWLSIAFPAVILNFMCGQNGFITTAIIGGGLLLLEERPILAGLVFGLLSYKPQFAAMIPLALLASRQWRALFASAVGVILFAAASFLIFGAPVWRAFIVSIPFTEKTVLEQGAINFRSLETVFGAIRMWGGSIDLAYAAQILIALYAAAVVVWTWGSRQSFAIRAAALAAGSLMVSPYVLQYDLVLLALPIAWTALEAFEKGCLPYEVAILIVAWIVPGVSVLISHGIKFPIGAIVIIVLMTAILRRALHENRVPGRAPARAVVTAEGAGGR